MPANLFTLTKAGDLIKNKAIANAVNIKRNGKAIAWLYQNTGNILDYKDGDKVKFDLTATKTIPIGLSFARTIKISFSPTQIPFLLWNLNLVSAKTTLLPA